MKFQLSFMLKSKLAGLQVFFVFLMFGCGLLSAQQNKAVYPEAVIPGTEVREFYSSINNQEYKLLISLPRGYKESSDTYPVAYLLDAQWDFPLVYAIYGEQYFDGFLPGLIIVGITWGGENPNPDDLRHRDFTPTDINSGKPSGNAEKFISFIGEELMPFIAMNYRASANENTLMGSSLGGLFTLYTLFKHNELFNRYVLTSPAIGWDNEITISFLKDFVNKGATHESKLYMAIGEYEFPEEFKKFAALLEPAENKGLEMDYKILEGMGHSGGKAEGYTRGLQYVFKKPEIQSDGISLKEYTGKYQIDSSMVFEISLKDEKLFLGAKDNYVFRLYEESKDKFYVKGMLFNVVFQRDSAGKISGFTSQRYEGNVFCQKIID